MKNIYVVIPNWNGADLISKCLNSLQAQTLTHKIVVVDNGSVDESISIIESDFPSVQLIKLTYNTGFAGGVNAGVKYSLKQGADAVALFNNDAIADENWLRQLIKAMQDNPNVGIATPKLLRINTDLFDSTGDCYSTRGIPFPRGRNEEDKGQYDNNELVFAASGGASCYRANMFNQIGFFDEKFFAYYEDVDLSFRAQLMGWDIMYVPQSRAYHHVSATSSKLGDFTRYHSIKNFLMLYTKNMPGSLFWKYLPSFMYQFSRTTISNILRGKFIVYLRALSFYILNIPAISRDRRYIQKRRKVSVSHIDQFLHKGFPPDTPPLK